MLRSTCLMLVSLYVLLQPFSSHCYCMGTAVVQKLEVIDSKLDKLLNMFQDSCDTDGDKSDCIDVKREASTVGAIKKTITGIDRPHYVLFTKSNDVFITGFGDGHVYRYDLAGNFKDKFAMPGNPTMMDIRGNILYITDHRNGVYTKDVSNTSPVKKILTLNAAPVGIKISDDGKMLYVGLDAGVVHIYNEKLVKIGEMKMNARPRKILIDADGNINVGTYASKIYVFNKNYELVRIDEFSGASNIDGYVINCDGSKILADRSGKIIFVNKNGQIEKTIGGYSSPADVGVAPDSDQTLWVADTHGNKVYLY